MRLAMRGLPNGTCAAKFVVGLALSCWAEQAAAEDAPRAVTAPSAPTPSAMTAPAAAPAPPVGPAAVPMAPPAAPEVVRVQPSVAPAVAEPFAATDAASGQSEVRTSRAQTMEEVATGSTHELRVAGFRSRYSLNFFGDTSFSASKPRGSTGEPSFAIGAQNFLLKGQLGGHIVATTEFAMELGDPGAFIDIERLHVRWQKEHFFVEAGRVHTAFGYWNNAYHHGRWLQPTIERPRWVAFEDDNGILPVHWVGVDAGLKIAAGTGSLNLTVSVGNSRGKIVDDVRSTRDYQAQKAVHAGIEYTGLGWPELRVGVDGIYGRIPAQPGAETDAEGHVHPLRPLDPDHALDEYIGGAHLAYASFPLILIVESYLVVHRDRVFTQNWLTYGGFGLVGYTVGPLTPYLEFERIATRGGKDPFFYGGVALEDLNTPNAPSFNTTEGVLGLRLDLSDWTALKAEYRNTRLWNHRLSIQEWLLNWSWGF
jgi:hypothetical protein